MLQLRVLLGNDEVARVGGLLKGASGVGQVIRSGTDFDGQRVMLAAEIKPEAVDDVIADMEARGVDPADLQVVQLDSAATIEAGTHSWLAARGSSLVWTSVVNQARENALFSGKYAAFMAIAGVIAAVGVLASNTILIVGAMAISPDLVPVTSAAVGIVGGRPRLVGRSLATLGLGFLCTIAAATATALAARLLGLVPAGYTLSLVTGVSTLAQFGFLIMVVAFVAGIAGILAFETKASAAVGVAISVTTIPAAAFVGVGLGLSQLAEVPQGAAVLVINVLLLVAGATAGLAVQRLVVRRRVAEGRSVRV
jgi:uncharacterized hydrophobic protein (TIGR00271 family)